MLPKRLRGRKLVAEVYRVSRYIGAKVVLPASENSTAALARFGGRLSKIARVAQVPPMAALNIAADKFALARFMEAQGIAHPETWDAADPDWGSLRYPLLVKPRKGFGGKGIVKVDSRYELSAALARLDPERFFLQEYIEGDDFGCSVLMKNGKVKAVTSQRGRARPREFAPFSILDVRPFRGPREATMTLMKALKWSGVAHVDLRRDARTGRVLVLEINSRYWASMPASVAMGVNFPDLACRLALGETFSKPAQRSGRFARWTQVVQDLFMLRRRVFRVTASELRSICEDPLPEIVRWWREGLQLFSPAAHRVPAGSRDHRRPLRGSAGSSAGLSPGLNRVSDGPVCRARFRRRRRSALHA